MNHIAPFIDSPPPALHTFTVRTPDERITELTVAASTRARAAAWVDASEYTIVCRLGGRR